MSVMVTVWINGTTPEKVKAVSAKRPELGEKIRELCVKHGLKGHHRYFSGDDILDLDEWETEEGFHAFVAEARPIIDELAELRGALRPTDKVWYPFV
jgi:hypothetical protein